MWVCGCGWVGGWVGGWAGGRAGGGVGGWVGGWGGLFMCLLEAPLGSNFGLKLLKP